ncbi:MAG: hypothetical protein G5703_07490 [Serratia symbiotica]|nr:hypothetical protein [Serratia symbiotica]
MNAQQGAGREVWWARYVARAVKWPQPFGVRDFIRVLKVGINTVIRTFKNSPRSQ